MNTVYNERYSKRVYSKRATIPGWFLISFSFLLHNRGFRGNIFAFVDYRLHARPPTPARNRRGTRASESLAHIVLLIANRENKRNNELPNEIINCISCGSRVLVFFSLSFSLLQFYIHLFEFYECVRFGRPTIRSVEPRSLRPINSFFSITFILALTVSKLIIRKV